MQENPYNLTNADKQRLTKGEKLGDQHVERFHQLIQIATSTLPRSILYSNKTERIHAISRGTRHLQIIHCCTDGCNECRAGHWICFFYDGEKIFIYNSLNLKSLYKNAQDFLRALCPFFDDVPVYSPDIQYQAKDKDCGPHAMAVATSVIFGEDSSTVDYDRKCLRKHILSMYKQNILIPFPKVNSMLTPIYVEDRARDDLFHIRGLPNLDGVSCYANATLQSIILCKSARQHFSCVSQMNDLSRAMRDYRAHSTVQIDEFREFADKIFSAKQQQDVSEFMTFLFARSDILGSFFKHTLVISRTCASCGAEHKDEMENYILNLHLPKNYKNCDLQMILDHNLNIWAATEIDCGEKLISEENISMEYDRNVYCRGKRMEKTDLTNNSDLMIVFLNISLTTHSGQLNKIDDLYLQHLSEKDVRIANALYTIESVILHHGPNIYHGHYTNILRGMNSWIRVDDTVLQQTTLFKNVRANPYIIILKKQKDLRQSSTTYHPILSINTGVNVPYPNMKATKTSDPRSVDNMITGPVALSRNVGEMSRLTESLGFGSKKNINLTETSPCLLRKQVPQVPKESRVLSCTSKSPTVVSDNRKLPTGMKIAPLLEKGHGSKANNCSDISFSREGRDCLERPKSHEVAIKTACLGNLNQNVAGGQEKEAIEGKQRKVVNKFRICSKIYYYPCHPVIRQ
ncbi:hypothetical protein QAD02_010409 [Eretmocerus hayati]|uniref:Uncharacterized protein n=1 Tax=Eretmocerus hayati TaxID=131215 RepID=A0ACC2NUT5_9HYME|nr:hypothetical protein QAD02_010409 [Eretmocerus hayati]